MIEEITNSSLLAALEIAEDKKLISKKNFILLSHYQNSLDFTEAKELVKIVGIEVIKKYNNDKNKIETLRNIIAEFLKKQKYIFDLIYGREVFFEYNNISENFHSIFEKANLLKDTSDFSSESKAVIEWWDKLANFASELNKDDDKLLILGRIGEEKTIKYELKKLNNLKINLKPKFVGQDDSRLGYDVVSFNKKKEKIFIEAKTSTDASGAFYFSRNQWNTALQKKEKYFVYIWIKENNSPRILDFYELQKTVPKDSKNSNWEKTIITPKGLN